MGGRTRSTVTGVAEMEGIVSVSGPGGEPGSSATESACGGDRETFDNTLMRPLAGTKMIGLCQASRRMGVGLGSRTQLALLESRYGSLAMLASQATLHR